MSSEDKCWLIFFLLCFVECQVDKWQDAEKYKACVEHNSPDKCD